ncbi:MAG: class I SAM-dependent methyltransferase [Opitutaceae bacterium]|nr:class I SAM-dependent methyltransferase [Opitutaceae bacterium]
MPDFTQTDWYRFPLYYDTVYNGDTPTEADFLEAVLAHHGRGAVARGKPARILEPACGTGRLLIELARRGHRAVGFDLSPEMVAYGRHRAKAEPVAVRRRLRIVEDRMEAFRLRGPFDLSFCLLSTFKYLLTEEHAHAHLERVARVLVRGGLCVIGIHLTPYGRRSTDREVWHGAADGLRVRSEVITRPADRVTRLESLRNRLTVRRRGVRGVERLETNWPVRTYDAAEFEALLARSPALEPIACYDFSHDIDAPRALDDSQEDVVVVLRKR